MTSSTNTIMATTLSRHAWGTIITGAAFFISIPPAPSMEGEPVKNTMLIYGYACFLVGLLMNAKYPINAQSILLIGLKSCWFVLFMLIMYERIRLQA